MEHFFIALGFLAGFLLIFGVNLFISDVLESSRKRIRVRMEEELRLQQRQRARGSLEYRKIHELATDGAFDSQANETRWQKFVRFVDESGLRVRPAQLALLSAGAALGAGLLVGAIGGKWILAAAALPLGAALPILYVSIVRYRRLEKLLSQLPDAFDLMSRTLRAGQTIAQALQAVADEFSSPIADEFGYCYDQQNLGLSPEAAMRDLARRTGLLELKIFVLAVMIHQQTGGNFADLLEKLAAIIRDRYRIRGVIKSLTADGRLQAVILLALPPAMLCILMAVNRPYVMTLFDYPLLLLATLGSMTLGGLWMKRIISFDF